MDQQPNPPEHTCPSRRSVVYASAAGLVSMAALTACGGATTGTMTDGTSMGADGQGSPQGQAGAQQGANGQTGSAQQAAGVVTVALDTVPKGGFTTATAPDGRPVVVARTKAGHVVAFSAICTHQSCQVMPSGEKLSCPCHGSEFSPMTGHVLRGPARKSLPKVKVKVNGQQIEIE